MGTRHLVGVIYNNEMKVAQYGQWDGYPEGQGATVLEFLRTADLSVFKEKLSNCTYITDEKKIREMYVMAGDKPDNISGFVECSVAEKFKEMWPSLSRDIGAGILEYIYNSESEVLLKNSEDFLEDSLFCEFAYILNLDNNTLICHTDGKKVFATYKFDELPTVEKMVEDYGEYQKTT